VSAAQVEIQLIAIVTAAACVLPGVFLVLRRMAMMSDAISHAILPGIVVAFFLTGSINSPLLIVAAAFTGLLTVLAVELVNRTGLVREDAAIGLVFPFLFSIGVILIARYASDVHLDTDAVLLGELAFAPFDRFVMFGWDIGPKSLYVMGVIGLLNLGYVVGFFKELKLATFDAELAAALGFTPWLLHYTLMSLVSLTTVGAFDAVGSILVVALMIGPPAAAHLLTDKLSVMIVLSVALGVVAAISGYWMATLLDASIAGCMATMVGVLFGATFLFAPERGIVAAARLRAYQRWSFAAKMLTIHLLQHEGQPEADQESRVAHLQEHLNWESRFANQVLRRTIQWGLVRRTDGYLVLTDKGRNLAREAVVQT
jgi:manganese/zinc/iron transport system permease protein